MHKRPYEKLIVWQEAHRLCLRMYQLADALPASEKYRLVHQICRSAYGIPMNIAEGNMRRSSKDKAHFLEMAIGSVEELHYQTRLAKDLGYVTAEQFLQVDQHIHKISFLLTRLRAAIL